MRLRDQQTATKSDYTDLTHCSSGNGYPSRAIGQRYGTNTTSKMQVFNSTPPSQTAPPSSHKERPSSTAADPFQARVDPLGDIRLVQSRDGGYVRARDQDQDCGTSAHTGNQSMDREHSSDTSQCRHSSRSSSNQNRRDHHDDNCHQHDDWDNHRSHSFRTAAEEEDWDEDQDRVQTSLKEAHHAYEEDQGHSDCSDDHIIGCDHYSGPPKPQPHGEQLTSRNTMYEDLKDSLVT